MIKLFTQSAIFALFAPLCTLVSAQNIPAVTGPSSPNTGFQLPSIPGTITFGISGTESYRTGFYSTTGGAWATTISGDAAYLSGSSIRPFTASLSSGYSFHSGSRGRSSPFLTLSLTQGFNLGRWNFTTSDTFRYLPEAPTPGFSGIPGLGNIGVPLPGPTTGQGILTGNVQQVYNTLTGGVSRNLTGRTSLNGSGTYSIQKFIGSTTTGLDNSHIATSVGLSHVINGRSTFGGGYSYAQYMNPSIQTTFASQGFHGSYSRQLRPGLSVNASLGPQRTSSSNVALVAPAWNLAGSAGISQTIRHGSINVDYTRGTRSGSGVIAGANSQGISVSADRTFGPYWQGTALVSYANHSSLGAGINGKTSASTSTVIGSLQASRGLGEYFSCHITYSASEQSSQNLSTTTNGFSGLSQTIALGVSYSTHPIHLGN